MSKENINKISIPNDESKIKLLNEFEINEFKIYHNMALKKF